MKHSVQPVTSASLPTPLGPYSPATRVGNLVFVSGQAGRDPVDGRSPARTSKHRPSSAEEHRDDSRGRRLGPVSTSSGAACSSST